MSFCFWPVRKAVRSRDRKFWPIEGGHTDDPGNAFNFTHSLIYRELRFLGSTEPSMGWGAGKNFSPSNTVQSFAEKFAGSDMVATGGMFIEGIGEDYPIFGVFSKSRATAGGEMGKVFSYDPFGWGGATGYVGL